ncbi:MAG: trehalose-phosphatase [Candidatus Zixiibacteriota bacterium]|nr:MAG: trehalose-phosphatase [candidate division Zixibacteria bacterium]
MEVVNTQFDLQAFYQQLASAESLLLMLDYDGTLAPFTTERDKAVPYPLIVGTLEGLLASDRTRVVIISGRTVDDLKKVLSLENTPELWGCHGLERYSREGQYSIIELSDDVREKLSVLYNWTAENQLVNFCEFKPSGGAFHWRGLPKDEEELIHQKVVDRWRNEADAAHLDLIEFDGGIEIRVAGTNKSSPVAQLMSESSDQIVAAYLGDDRTDEDAFEAIKGRGAAVLVNENLRDTRADIWIRPPDELDDFLRRWI